MSSRQEFFTLQTATIVLAPAYVEYSFKVLASDAWGFATWS